jgi:protein kinase C substrate 80K-H
VFDAAAYLPAALVPQFDAFRGTLLSWFRTFGLAAGGASDADSEAANRARQNLNAAEATLRDAEKERADTDAAIAGLADPAKFGPAGEWKKLDGTCLEHNAGEYTYEVCLFGEARQKPNKGGQTFSLGCVCAARSGPREAEARADTSRAGTRPRRPGPRRTIRARTTRTARSAGTVRSAPSL